MTKAIAGRGHIHGHRARVVRPQQITSPFAAGTGSNAACWTNHTPSLPKPSWEGHRRAAFASLRRRRFAVHPRGMLRRWTIRRAEVVLLFHPRACDRYGLRGFHTRAIEPTVRLNPYQR